MIKEQKIFKDSLPNEFIYYSSNEVKKIYIDRTDRVKKEFIFFGIIVHNNYILNSKDNVYKRNMTNDELCLFLNTTDDI